MMPSRSAGRPAPIGASPGVAAADNYRPAICSIALVRSHEESVREAELGPGDGVFGVRGVCDSPAHCAAECAQARNACQIARRIARWTVSRDTPRSSRATICARWTSSTRRYTLPAWHDHSLDDMHTTFPGRRCVRRPVPGAVWLGLIAIVLHV